MTPKSIPHVGVTVKDIIIIFTIMLRPVSFMLTSLLFIFQHEHDCSSAGMSDVFKAQINHFCSAVDLIYSIAHLAAGCTTDARCKLISMHTFCSYTNRVYQYYIYYSTTVHLLVGCVNKGALESQGQHGGPSRNTKHFPASQERQQFMRPPASFCIVVTNTHS